MALRRFAADRRDLPDLDVVVDLMDALGVDLEALGKGCLREMIEVFGDCYEIWWGAEDGA